MVGVPVLLTRKKIKTDHVVECFLNMTHPNYLSDLSAQQFYFPQA